MKVSEQSQNLFSRFCKTIDLVLSVDDADLAGVSPYLTSNELLDLTVTLAEADKETRNKQQAPRRFAEWKQDSKIETGQQK